MNSNRCSESVPGGVALLVAVVGLLALAPATVAAIDASPDGVPDDAEVGSDVSASFTLTDLYGNATTFTLQGETELTDVAWTVRRVRLDGSTTRESFGGGSFQTTISSEDDVERVVVTVRGTVPGIQQYTYDPHQSFTMARLTQVTGENPQPIAEPWTVEHHTSDSRNARQAIDSAATAVEETGAGERDLQQAISAYENRNFANAVSNAEDAEAAAQGARRSARTTQLVLVAVGAVVVVGLLGFAYYRTRGDEYDRLG
jgi:hypothetical protein